MRPLLFLVPLMAAMAQPRPPTVTVDWNKTTFTSRTTPTLQVVFNPPLRRGSSIHDRAFAELRALGADYVRFVPWLPYPRLAVAELEPGKWDFSVIDPLVEDFMSATSGHSVILNFSTIPQWIFVTPKPIPYPADPDQVVWDYTQGTELRDPSGRELGDYYARLVSWYTQGGFTDENGQRHDSSHHYRIPYWEVLNEVDFEHEMKPEQYTARYDAIVAAIHRVSPETKFVGMALAAPSSEPQFFEYFLNPKNHRPGTPLDFISYHFYATPSEGQTPDHWQYTFWDQADHFLDTVRYVEAIRKRLSPATRTTIDEIGSILPGDNGISAEQANAIPASYWDLSGAMYAYVFAQLSAMGIEVAGESQLVGYPTQFPSVSMVDWNTGAPNARLRVLHILKDNFGPGDRLMETKSSDDAVYAQGFLNAAGKKKVLLINKRLKPVTVQIAGGAPIELKAFGVMVAGIE